VIPTRAEPAAASLDALRNDWNAMAERAQNVFGTWEWASAWWRHFGNDAEAFWIRCRGADGKTFAIVPLCLRRTASLRVVRLVGHGPADELGPLCAPGDRAATAAMLPPVLADARADAFVAETLRREDKWAAHLNATVRAEEPSPLLQLGGAWDEFLSSRSSNFRQQVRRRERALRAHGLHYRLSDDQARLERDLDLLFALHAQRWGGEGSDFMRHAAFHREFAALAFERGWLRLWFLELNGREVAAWYGLRFGKVDWYYQAGRDRAWDRFAVGFVLLAHSLREAIADGMREYRFGRGDEEYKHRFTDDAGVVETAVLPASFKGRVAVATAQVARRTWAKRLLRPALRL
jgi:CelD/BcsL family acetyltransferase involved in cellulose biosynthesis